MPSNEEILQFLPIPNAPGYAASSDGTIWSCVRMGRETANSRSEIWHPLTGRVIPNGYVQVKLRMNGRRVNPYVHQLILWTFRGPCPEGMECRHRDGVRQHNWLSNLGWGTPAENAADKLRHGTHNQGIRHPLAKLGEAEVLAIRAEYALGGISQKALAEKYGVSFQTIHLVVRRKNWKCLSPEAVTVGP